MADNQVLRKIGSPPTIILADATDFDNTPIADTDQIDLTSLANGGARQSDKFDFDAEWAELYDVHAEFEIDVAATAISDGLVIDSGFLSGAKDKKESGNIGEELMNKLFLANNIAGDTGDILSVVISIINSDGNASDVGASITWKEER